MKVILRVGGTTHTQAALNDFSISASDLGQTASECLDADCFGCEAAPRLNFQLLSRKSGAGEVHSFCAETVYCAAHVTESLVSHSERWELWATMKPFSCYKKTD